MEIRTLNRGQAQEAMKEWVENYPKLPIIDEESIQLRTDIHNLHKKVREEIDKNPDVKKADYYLDYRFGLLLYEYFSLQRGFTLRVAADDGFWRFLSVKIVPDIVAQRWGKDNESHFWSQPTRIWLRSLWWYVFLSWQGSMEKTEAVLSSPHFSTDTILNFEERTGRKGTYISVYRHIIRYYGLVSTKTKKNTSGGKQKNDDDLFRTVMKLNTAKLLVMDPALYEGGEEAYAKDLFADAGVTFSDV